MDRNMQLVQAAASFALTGTGGSCSAVVDLVSVLKGLSIVCWAIPSGPLLLVRPYPYIGERYMGNKYHVLHRHLSRLSRRDDLELGVAVTSIHRAAEKKSYRRFPTRSPPRRPIRAGSRNGASTPR